MAELRMMREIQPTPTGWDIPILATQAHHGVGVEALSDTLEAHRRFLEESGALQRRRAQHRRSEFWALLEHRLRQRLRQREREDCGLARLVEQVAQAEVDPHTAAASILDDEATLRRWLLPATAGTQDMS
jgi:LAO/AO transport system kinase